MDNKGDSSWLLIQQETEFRQYLELMNPTLRALRRLGGSASIDEISREVTKDLGLPQSIVDTLHLTGPRN